MAIRLIVKVRDLRPARGCGTSEVPVEWRSIVVEDAELENWIRHEEAEVVGAEVLDD